MRIVSSVTPYVVKVIILLCMLQTVSKVVDTHSGTPYGCRWCRYLGSKKNNRNLSDIFVFFQNVW